MTAQPTMAFPDSLTDRCGHVIKLWRVGCEQKWCVQSAGHILKCGSLPSSVPFHFTGRSVDERAGARAVILDHEVIQPVQSLSRVCLFATPWTAACQASLSITNSQGSLKLMSIELVIREKQRRGHSCWQSVTGVFQRMAPRVRTWGLRYNGRWPRGLLCAAEGCLREHEPEFQATQAFHAFIKVKFWGLLLLTSSRSNHLRRDLFSKEVEEFDTPKSS